MYRRSRLVVPRVNLGMNWLGCCWGEIVIGLVMSARVTRNALITCSSETDGNTARIPSQVHTAI